MRSLTFITFALLTACGSDPGTTATDSASGSTSSPGTTGTATTGDPGTTATGDPAPTTGSASASESATETATGTTTDASTTAVATSGSTGPELTSSTGPVATDTGSESGSGSSSGDAESSSSGSDTTGAIMDCATLEAEFNAETLKIRSCTMPADCGQELKMTSCGCTRNWVARKDADTTHFYDLLALGQDLECELIGPSTCDCPAAEGFTCKQNTCTWNYL